MCQMSGLCLTVCITCILQYRIYRLHLYSDLHTVLFLYQHILKRKAIIMLLFYKNNENQQKTSLKNDTFWSIKNVLTVLFKCLPFRIRTKVEPQYQKKGIQTNFKNNNVRDLIICTFRLHNNH